MEGHPPSAADVRSEQDKAAASADRAADEASRRAAPNAVVSGDYPPLPQGPALTSGALVEAIVRMAKSFETRADMAPTHVALVSGLEVTPDSQGRRTGLQGSLGGALRVRRVEALRTSSWAHYRADRAAFRGLRPVV